MHIFPQARNADIVVQKIGEEVLIYDLNTHKAYNLNKTSAIVYNACDGKTSFERFKAANNFPDEIIFLALDELKKENLLEKNERYASPFSGISRREAVRKVALASVVALPVVSSLVAPRAANAQSGITDPVCTTPGGILCATTADCTGTEYCDGFISCSCILNCCVGEDPSELP